MKKIHYRKVILSDVHLGSIGCSIDKVNHFIKNITCKEIILNGDIVDGWQLKRKGRWTKNNTRFVRLLLKKMEKDNTQITYLRGNHDDVLSRILPLKFDLLAFRENIQIEFNGRRYFVFHGDIYDTITSQFTFLAHIGDFGYQTLLRLNRIYNRYRNYRGKPYYSISKVLKAKVKRAVNFISNFEEKIVELAKARNCDGVICGHIHTPADKIIDGVHYLNSGDWVESMTAIVEHMDGKVEVLEYNDFLEQLNAIRKEEQSPINSDQYDQNRYDEFQPVSSETNNNGAIVLAN
ncbi:MAG: UDP-2,3-diacylglucosamine hydrolase [Opitutia bacterium TMED67]|nr:UDP-2,3-diacylglucosamine hydrolase [Verrucomicrobiales bacterium]OUU72997.1 MAG: UDP-2,3-diacylglucosamine hydrolase [Opitutae bacterium TMED67]